MFPLERQDRKGKIEIENGSGCQTGKRALSIVPHRTAQDRLHALRASMMHENT
jgi:hypothetical protein